MVFNDAEAKVKVLMIHDSVWIRLKEKYFDKSLVEKYCINI